MEPRRVTCLTVNVKLTLLLDLTLHNLKNLLPKMKLKLLRKFLLLLRKTLDNKLPRVMPIVALMKKKKNYLKRKRPLELDQARRSCLPLKLPKSQLN